MKEEIKELKRADDLIGHDISGLESISLAKKSKINRSKYWPRLVACLEEQFPKGLCKERGAAIVLLAYAEMMFKEARQEVKEKILKGMLAECNRTENEQGRLLVEKFLKEI